MPNSITIRAAAVRSAKIAATAEGGEHGQAQAAQYHLARAGQRVHQRRAERAVEPGERPHREQHGRGSQRLGAQRAVAGVISGSRLDSAPGDRVTVSRITATADRLQDDHADQGQVNQMRGVGQEADRQRGQDRAGPLPIPGDTALANVPSSRSMSSMAAPIAPSAAPVDRPWTIRAASSAGTPAAVAKITSEHRLHG